MTAAGIAVVVFAAVLMLALARGIHRRLNVSGEPENMLLISSAGQNIIFSSISEDEMVPLAQLPGVAADAAGDPMISPEILHMTFAELPGDGGAGARRSVDVRGVSPVAYGVHKSLELIAGRLPAEPFEVIAGRSAHTKLDTSADKLAPGAVIKFEDKDWTVCGTFECGGSLAESELWTDGAVLQDVLRRRTPSFVVVRFESPAACRAGMELMASDGSLRKYFRAWTEPDYYRQFATYLAWVVWLSTVMVAAVGFAGALIGANTMYTAIIKRIREIGVCRVLGFTRADILLSLVGEALALSLLGGVVGVGAGLLINGLPLKLSYGVFYLTADATVVLSALGLCTLIGLVGSLFPAMRGLRLTIVEALRHE